MSAVREADVVTALVGIVGEQHVKTDDYSVSLYAQDVFTRDLPALAVVSPENTDELVKVVAAVTGAGHSIIARGGGMSYTSGYVPQEAGSIIVDTQRMNRVLDINETDMYVTVESGCSWQALHEALDGTGLRTPYWGTLSGLHATVGGSVSQNSIFWGSSRHGSAADSVLGLEVVLADGSIVSSGSGAQKNSEPFFRHFGPDLTGLFTCDNGALGLKATITLRLIPVAPHRESLSFDFADYPALLAAMSDISRADLADECFAFDPYLQAVRMQRESLTSDVRKFAGVLKSSGSILGAIKDGAKVAIAGRGFMDDVQYSLHVMIEQRVAAAASEAADDVRKICVAHGGNEIENSIPKILRANPFSPLNNIVGPNGERWVPVHTLVPHSRAESTFAGVKAIFEQHAELMEEHGIGAGFLLATVSTNCFVIEPVFFTPDSLTEIHEETVEDDVLARMPGFESNPAAADATAKIRGDLIAFFSDVGGVHLQIGKAYPYREGLRPESWRVIEQIKQSLDPDGRINPG
ncbi:MAG: FAD-binding oxidoreductase, partial [Woeseiaceae bacterium]